MGTQLQSETQQSNSMPGDDGEHSSQRGNFKDNLIHDFLSSLVIFLVALPLCLGIAIASGVPPELGIISGIIGGLVVGSLSGCPLQVTGPAAGLVAVNVEMIAQVGFEKFGIVVLLAGLIQLTAGVLRLGQWFRAVTPAVIQGMLAGIGVLIFASQFHVMVDDKPSGSAIQNLLQIPQSIYKGLFPMDGTTHHLAAAIGVITILTMILWEKRPKKLQMIPAPLVAVLLATLGAAIWGLNIKYVTINPNLFHTIQFPAWGDGSWLWSLDIWTMALTVAVIASAETLLTANAVDLMQTRYQTNYNKEIIAQGVGNTIAGLLGALPVTGVIVRSAANVQAGARTRMSSMMHGFWLLGIVALFPFILTKIPVASLAAILVYTGYKLVNVKTLRKLWFFSRTEAVIYLITLVAIVTTGLLEGVVIGLVATVVKLVHTFSSLDVEVHTSDDQEEVNVILRGSATFLAIPKLSRTLESIQPLKKVRIHVDELQWVDHACLETLMNSAKRYNATGGDMHIEWQELAERFCQLDAKDSRVIAITRAVQYPEKN